MGYPIVQSGAPSKEGWSTFIAVDGSGYQEYVGMARSTQPIPTVALIGALGLVSITNSGTTATVAWTAHGLATGNRVIVLGATVDTDLNGSYPITVTGADAFTFTTASVGNAAYTEATLGITTSAPRASDPVWSIMRIYYAGSAQTSIRWQEGRSDANAIWANRATLSYQ